ncbi:hypothetical protein RB2083_2425 [Rhodobacteraceae bacterium HTCC2083]|jgi:hypothetical protein|nr:hypothetical protein RB2083_2425 [Rhodobacteraceae bacterium HTCC2083]
MNYAIIQVFGALVLCLCALAAEAQTGTPSGSAKVKADPETLREALADEKWFQNETEWASLELNIPLSQLIKPSSAAETPLQASILNRTLEEFTGTVFQLGHKQVEYVSTEGDQDVYVLSKKDVESSDEVNLSKGIRATSCSVMSLNELTDGIAHAFQFSQNKGEGYSLSFVIYDYKGPGEYVFNSNTKSYVKYLPNAIGAAVMATRALEDAGSALSQFSSSNFGAKLTVRELPDKSLFGRFSVMAAGTADPIAVSKGARDKFSATPISGVFRTASLAEPVVIKFKPLTLIQTTEDAMEPIVPKPATGVKVLARTDCPPIE